jgi:peptide-methionine (R)-S-oxide reductase
MMNEEEIRKKVGDEAYRVLREKGTEAPYSGEYVHAKDKGMYRCKVCGAELFSSEAKVDSEKGPEGLRGWPSFDNAIAGAIRFEEDTSHGMKRTEVLCSNCGSHLGHIFDDDSTPTGKHYCINSVCLDLDKK